MYIYIHIEYIYIIWGLISSYGQMCPHEVENCVLHFASVPRMVGISSYAPASAFSNRQEVKMGTSETGVLAGFLVSPNSHRQWCIWDPFLWHFWWWKWWSTIGQNWLPWDSWFWEAWEHVWKHMLVMILFPCHLAFVLLRMGVTVRGVSPIPGWTSGSCTGPSPAALSQRLRSICTGSGGLADHGDLKSDFSWRARLVGPWGENPSWLPVRVKRFQTPSRFIFIFSFCFGHWQVLSVPLVFWILETQNASNKSVHPRGHAMWSRS